jgi:hypothetical protein
VFERIGGCAFSSLGPLFGFAGTLLGPVDPGDDFVKPPLPFALFELQLGESLGESGATFGIFSPPFDLLEPHFSLLQGAVTLYAVGAQLALDGGEARDRRRGR